MKTAELIKEIANELMLDSDYYGAYFDEVRKIKRGTLKEFEEQMKPIDEKFPAINVNRASLLLMLLNQKLSEKSEASEAPKAVN
mgnify:CR=1 FL=1